LTGINDCPHFALVHRSTLAPLLLVVVYTALRGESVLSDLDEVRLIADF